MRNLVARLAIVGMLGTIGAVAVLPATTATSALACGDCGPGSSGSLDDDGGVVVVTDGDSDDGSPGGSNNSQSTGPSHPLICHVYSSDDSQNGEGDAATPLDTSTIAAGTDVWQVCMDTVTSDIVYAGPFTWGPGQVTAYVPPRTLAQHARAALVLPTPSIRTWPAPSQQVVRVPTWLHVDNFTTESRTASVGGVTATVTAEPTSVGWTMGDGSHVECATGGAVFTPGSSNQDLSDCAYAFEHTSAREPGQMVYGSVTITWHLRWTSNIGPGGDLGTLTRQAPIGWRVEQIQSIITREGSP